MNQTGLDCCVETVHGRGEYSCALPCKKIGDEERRLVCRRVALYCVDKVRYLPGLHRRYWDRLDEERRETVWTRTKHRVCAAQGGEEYCLG